MSLLAECAHGAARTISSQFYGYHRLLARRIGYKRAILATAHSQAKDRESRLLAYPPPPPMAYLQSRSSRPRGLPTVADHLHSTLNDQPDPTRPQSNLSGNVISAFLGVPRRSVPHFPFIPYSK